MNKIISIRYLSVVWIYILPFLSAGQTESTNIIISNKIQNLEFVKGNVMFPVMVKEKVVTTFKCNGFRTTIPFVELYDNNTTIDDVKIYVNGDKAKDIKPLYSYYSIDDIFYSDARICYFGLPLEKKNTESRVTVEKTVSDPRYFTTVYFDDIYKVENETVVMKVPSWMKLEIKEYNFPTSGITKNVQQTGDATVYTYTIKEMGARKRNAYAPGPSFLYPHLLVLSHAAAPPELQQVTYFKTVADQYKWYHGLVNEIGNQPSVFIDKVNEIVKDKKTDAEKIQAIYSWVQSNIRYIAFEDGIAGYKPEKAQDVFRHKYGDCKGMANLTKEMLKAAGYDARLCWIGTNHIAYDYSTPSLAVDNHMICAVKLDGKFNFLDATETYIGYGEYAERIAGRQVLIEDNDNFILDRIPVPPGTQNTQTIRQVLKMEGANISGTVELNYKGESKENMIAQLNSITTQKRDAALKQFLTDNNNSYTIDNVVTKGWEDWNQDLSIQYNMRYENAITEFGDEKYIDVDARKEFSGLHIDSARNVDYLFSHKYHISNITELTLPVGFVVEELPAPLVITTNAYSFTLSYALAGDKLTYTKELVMLQPAIKVQEFPSWNNDIEKLNNYYNEQIKLKKQ